MRYRTAPDGSLIFPARGGRPDLVPGYVYDPHDQYRQTPVLPECPLRADVTQTLSCGKKITFSTCVAGHECGYNQCLDCIKSGKRDRSI